ncbi:MAG TPA: hypothetical protein VIO37_01770 [Candidatus Dormibacteraeota bacterium]|jgi:hypothetical protein
MSKRRVGIGALAAGLMLVGGPQTVSANVLWCDDPPIEVVTPGGTLLTVNNMIYLSQADLHSASLITQDATAAPDGMSGTLITVNVYIPAAVHDGANVVSSNYRYSVSDTGGTTTGASVVTLYLDVPIT